MRRLAAWFPTRYRVTSAQPTLRFLLVITFSGVALTLVALLSLIVGQISARQLEQDARQSLTLLAAEMAERMDHELTERYNEIVLIATTDLALRTPGLSLISKGVVLEKLQELHPDYIWIGLMDPAGTVLVATDNQLVGLSVADRGWFQAGRTAPFLGEVRAGVLLAQALATKVNRQDQLRLVDFAAPIVSDDGQLLGVLAAHLDWQWARRLEQQVLRPVLPASDVEIFVTDPAGSALLTPADWQGALLDPTTLDLAQGTGTLVDVWPDQRRYVTSFATIPARGPLANLHWLILARQPLRTAYAPAWQTQWQIFRIGAIFAALFALVAWWLANRITHQLVTLTHAAEAIRQGQSHAIPILAGTAEVATLSTSLNQLIADLTTATESERNRIARELHDSVTQTLFSTSMLADVLPKLWESDPALGRTKLEELRLAVRGALAEMRTLLLELRPTAIADADLHQLIRQLADATTGRTGVTVTWRIEGEVQLAPDHKVVIYRTLQEALNNIVKHAEATTARLLLRHQHDRIALIIADDGHGFSPDQVTSDHFGLRMMRERIEASGGLLRIESNPDEGTVLYAEWPARRQAG